MKNILISIILILAIVPVPTFACESGLIHDGGILNQGVMYEVSKTIADFRLEEEKQLQRREKNSQTYKNILAGKYEPECDDECFDCCSIPCDSLGVFTAFAYCSCYECNGEWTGCRTASGTTLESGRTIAVDSTIIPLGSHIYVEFPDGGVREYIAEDTGNFSGKILDVYFDNHSDCLQFGRQQVKVYLIK